MHSPSEDTPSDPLEDLLAEALATHEAGGDAALAAFLERHPQASGRLRQALEELRGADLLHETKTGLPTAFGEFRITGRLGAGGMGVVYLAEQATLGREVALKVVRPELLLFDGARERFRREIETVARLEHPALVPILATGHTDGVPWYAMPRLRGRSADAVLVAFGARQPGSLSGADLRALLADGEQGARNDGSARATAGDGSDPFAGSWWQCCVRAVRQAALGIHHAHTRGVLHRDLKPSNLMLLPDGRAVVLDFGLAQAAGDASLTRTGSAAGSPAYMAPEQVRAEPADERTDVYGLGATLHALLGLRSPFALTQPELLRQRIVAGERLPLRDRAALPAELQLVLDTAMEVDRARRYASALSFADDLQALLEGRAITARRLPVSVRARRFVQRHRTLAAAGAVGLACLAAMPALLLWQQQRANRALTAQIARAERNLDVSLDAVDSLLSQVAADKVRNTPAMQRTAAAMLGDASALFDRLDDDPARHERVATLRGRVLSRLAHLQYALGEPEQAAATAHRLLAALPPPPAAATPRQSLDAADARTLLAFLAVRKGDRAAAETAVAAAIAALAPALRDPEQRRPALHQMASLAELRGKLADDRGDRAAAEAALREGVAAATEVVTAGGSNRPLASARLALASQLRHDGEHAEAAQLLEAVIATGANDAEPEVGWPVPRVQRAYALHEMALLLQDRGDATAADARFRATLDLLDGIVRDYPDDPSMRRLRGRTIVFLANAANAQQRFADARQLLETGRSDLLQVLAGNPDDTPARESLGSLLRSLARSLRELGDWHALEPVARELGKLPDSVDHTGRAGRDLLRCAEMLVDRAPALRDEALRLLLRAAAVGMKFDGADPLYQPLRGDARFEALLPAPGGR